MSNSTRPHLTTSRHRSMAERSRQPLRQPKLNGPSGTKHLQSGTGPARKTPRPASLGTSGTLSETISRYEIVNGDIDSAGNDHPEIAETLSTISLPDVPDPAGPTPIPAGRLPDAAPIPAGRGDLLMPGDPGQPSLRMEGTLRVGVMTQRRESFTPFANPELRALLGVTDLPADTVIEAEPAAQIQILDVDTHHWTRKPEPEELNAHLASFTPVPDAAWISHGRGWKLVFAGANCYQRALATAFSIPNSFHVERLRHTRHPGAASSKHGEARCGPVQYFTPDPDETFSFRQIGRLTPEARTDAIERLGLTDGRRFDHDKCPLRPIASSDAKDCVSVLDQGVYCHRCAGKGVRHRPSMAPGYYPFLATSDTATTKLDELADSRVHWTHAELELSHDYPHLGKSLLEQAYRLTLYERYGEDDPRLAAVFNPDLDFVRADGLWLAADRLTPTIVDNDAADGMPYCQYLSQNAKGETAVAIDKVRRSQVKNRMPAGYRPVRPVIGISFTADDGTIPVLREPRPRFPIELLPTPMSEDEAIRALSDSFPGVDTRYLQACLAGAICGEAGHGMPPALACTGPSGSGKEQHIRLAASFVGDDIVKLSLSDDDEKLRRQIGTSITSGHRFLVFDEFGKTRKLPDKLKTILEISGTIDWRLLYQSQHVSTPVRAAFFYPCVRFPDLLTGSQEFNRRVRHVHLYRQLPNWALTSGGDTGEWRNRNATNARIANSILTHAWRLCHEHDFRFN